MKLIRKILVALDGSQSANNALEYALDLAEKYASAVVLLTVVEPVIVPKISRVAVPPVPKEVVDKYKKGLKAGHQKILSKALKKVQETKGDLDVSTELVEGKPSEKIVEVAREGDLDIIVMGSRGLGGIKEVFLGSVSDRVADQAPCPVLVVK